jgi:hypothetical protein
MRPLEPEERKEILARNPRATEADIDAFEDLLAERHALQRADRSSGDVELAEGKRLRRLAEVEEALDALEARVLPRFEDAVAAVAARRFDRDEDLPVG